MTKQNWSRIVLVSLFMVFALVATAALGVWQYTIAHRTDISQQVLQAPPQSLEQVSSLGEYVGEQNYGQLVTFTGQLKCEQYVWVTLDAQSQPWLMCPVQMTDGTLISVVLGTPASKSVANALSAIDVQITGRMQPAQDTSQLSAIYQPADVHSVEYLNTDDLVIRWQSDVRDGYVVMTDIASNSDVTAFKALTEIADAALVLPPVGIEVRNLFYAWQWWIFAAFAIFIWFRFVRDEIQATRFDSDPTKI